MLSIITNTSLENFQSCPVTLCQMYHDLKKKEEEKKKKRKKTNKQTNEKME